MAKKKTIVKRIKKSRQEIKDTIVFMTAYDIRGLKRHFPRFWQRKKAKDMLRQYHISGISCENMYASPDAKCNYTVEYDSLKQVSAFHFDESVVEIRDKYPYFMDEMMTILSLRHSVHALLDSSQINVSMCFNLDSFLVAFDEKILQVDPIAFIMNNSLIVSFELIDFESAVPLCHDAIYGRNNNYGIKPVSKIKYFNEPEFVVDDRKISDIIFHNIFDFMSKAEKGKFEVADFSFLHNILVISNKIENTNEYFQKVLGAQIDNFNVENISTSNTFNYYSTEYMGVATQIIIEDAHNILYDCVLLESFKVYLLLKMIIDYEVNHKLDKIIDNQIYTESLFFPSRVPIITLNVIDNLKETDSFSRYKQAIDFKIQTLKIIQDRKRNSNGKLMNILLYILALLGSAQTLQVLHTELGLPFKSSFWIVVSLFAFCGIVWICREVNK